MRPTGRALAVALLTVMVSAAGLSAQGRRWSEPYESGVDDVNHQRWTRAVASLTQAIQADPKAQSNKHIEGTYYEDYFPYYYRGLAYLALGDLTNAQADFRKAHETRMPAALTTTLQQRESELQAALARQAPKPTPPPASSQTPPPAAAQPSPDATKPPAPAAPDRTAQAAALVRQGGDLLTQGQLDDAQAKFQQAQRIGGAGAAGADEGLQRVAGRRTFESLKAGATADRRAGRPDDALAKYDEARKVDPAQYAADHLDAERQQADREAAARRQPAVAPVTPPPPSVAPSPVAPPIATAPARNASPAPARGSVAGPPPAPAPPLTPASPPIYDALVSYLRGDVDRAVALLQPLAAADGGFDAAGRAAVHGYLGAAYATSALEARSSPDRDRWREKADAEFRLAERAKPGFTLSARVVSPAIQAMIDAARRR